MIYDEENNSCIVYREERLKDDGTQRLVSFYNNHPCCEGNYCEEALDTYIDEEGYVID